MSSEIPQKIGIITVSEEKKLDTEGTRSSEDFGGTLGSRSEITTEIVGIQRTEIELEKLNGVPFDVFYHSNAKFFKSQNIKFWCGRLPMHSHL